MDVLWLDQVSLILYKEYTLSTSAAACFLASFSAFLARPDSFFALPPFGAISSCYISGEKLDLNEDIPTRMGVKNEGVRGHGRGEASQ